MLKEWTEYRGYWIKRTEFTSDWRIASGEPDGRNTVAYLDSDLSFDEIKKIIDDRLLFND